MKNQRIPGSALPTFACACATVRRAARLLTQLYDEELRPDLQASQFSLLCVLEAREGCTQSMLARAAAFDKTTVSRTLGLMRRKGWIEQMPAGDLRERGLRLTPAGQKLLDRAKPRWRRAQQRLRSEMTAHQWQNMWRVLNDLTSAAHHARKTEGR